MTRSEEYRSLADECVRIANSTENAQGKAFLLLMAQKWLELAERAEAQLGENQTGG
jgi:hypothetical protein